MTKAHISALAQPLTLPCGATLKNRIAKSAMSVSLGDGTGTPTEEQINLYRHCARGGLGLSIIGEVQGTPGYPEKPGSLILNSRSDVQQFMRLAKAAQQAAPGSGCSWATQAQWQTPQSVHQKGRARSTCPA